MADAPVPADAADILGVSPVIPVVTLDDPNDAVPVARALVDGGVPIIELTLRTETALSSLERIAAEVPDIVLGAGTVLTPRQAKAAADAGAQFLVSPGATPALLDGAAEAGVPLLPGVATVSEALQALEHGITALKFFPAGPAGGPEYLAALAAPLAGVTFCPTGGISVATAPDYLALPNVACVGGSWLTPRDAVAAREWGRIAELARRAAALGVSAG
ncbi:bifunctional 4-hydroxy-2-oxoglutarate aldolase/2-dehydro-3-deoxy-phosphogluconate aldolase [Sinomonas mesophila]|uniref:bifunctional 4-hydroxy-2-oxoglutarate aldolase/2-dehydro-3-deoxy-phosphogluconate aldolase n=1 Tax=Sinomonas mesophila TaxID=1531955 RepID=UPI000984DC6D|nr:bifunctional 4-hydroxy-2-oxoglutarate aldolase/2-dehydro-3-deoxy-phosphogluconate aldolase [Sinomonas mesophila]